VQGSVASFSVQASSAGSTAAYQWRRNGVDIAGATAASYTTSALGPADDGARFSVLVSNTAGSVLSSEALLRVTPLAGAPTISAQPQDAAVLAGASAQFSVTATATGGGTLGYQWYRNGSAIAGATAASYTTPVLAWTDHGALYSVVVGLAGANVSSRTATLTVNPRVQQVSAGTAMVMALMENGQVLGIGRSAALAIGTPTSNSSTVPQWARTADGAVLTGITGLRTGWEYTVAWTSAGTLWTWGSGNSSLPGSGYGATVMKRADGSALPAMRNADGGINSANAVALDGAVWQWGLTPSGSLPAPSVANAADRVALSDIRQSSAYGDHAAALKGDGTVWLWGTAQFGVLGNGTTSGSRSYAAALTDAAGNLVTGAREVRVGAGHSVVLLQDGTVLAFGRNFWGELGDGTQTQRTWPVAVRTSDGRVLDQVTAIQAASDATAYLRSDGTVWMTGRNVEGLMARPSSTTQVSSPTRVLMANGQPLDNVVQMSMHGNVVVVLRGDGSVWGWGATSQGQLGTTTTLSAGCICSTTPVRLPLSP
jgi:alpha-tubulin suppressor-like RCC1 family protein